jgi:hypothetical protein
MLNDIDLISVLVWWHTWKTTLIAGNSWNSD